MSKDRPPAPPRASEKVKVGFIGVGSRGGALLRSMLKVPGSEIVAVADVNDEAVGAAIDNIVERDGTEAKDKIFGTDDYKELLKKEDVEAVVIATPHFMHGPMAMDALEAGKHVYVEKAMAFTIGECLDLYKMVKSLGNERVFQVGHQRHYSKLYRAVRDMVQGGRIGNVTAIRAQWNRNDQVARPSPDPKLERLVNWRLYSEYSGGLMTEFASHQIDVANMVLALPPAAGEPHKILFPESVCGMGGMDYPRSKRQKGRDTSDNVQVIYSFRVPFRERRKGPDGKWAFLPTGESYRVHFAYMSIMTNELLGPTEMIFGDEGTIEASLAGGDFWKEPKALTNPENQAEGTNPASTHQKSILKTGATISAVKKGIKKSDEEIAIAKDRTDWSDFVGEITGEHSPQETLLALDGFLSDIRKCRKGDPFHVAANVDVGLGGAAAAIMGNIAMRENRTVTWKEFQLPDPT
jgi:predicted dehydrogenase